MRLAAVETSLLVRSTEPLQLFQQARTLGLEGLELVVTPADLQDAGRLSRLRNARDSAKVEITSIRIEQNHKDIASPTTLTAFDVARRAVKWAVELNVSTLIIPFSGESQLTTDEALDRAVKGLRLLVELAAQQGISLCYDGTLPAVQIQRLAHRLGSNAFGCCVDLASLTGCGMDPATEITALRDLIRHIYVSDLHVNPGDCALGFGSVDFAASAAALRQIGFDGWLVLKTMPRLPEVLGREISYVRRRFPEVTANVPWPRLGMFSYVVNEQVSDPIGRVIDKCHEFDISNVQIGLRSLDVALQGPDEAHEVAERFLSNGITISAIAGYRNITALNLEKRRENIDFIKRCLHIAPILGTSIVATETGTLHPTSDWTGDRQNWSAEAWSALYAAIDELLDVAQETKTILALEGYVNNVLATYAQLTWLLERYPVQNLQAVLDPYNYLSRHLLPAKDRLIAEFLNRFESRFVLAHLKDVAPEGAEIDTPEFGNGIFPQKPYIDYLKTIRPDLPLVLEHLPESSLPAAVQRVCSFTG